MPSVAGTRADVGTADERWSRLLDELETLVAGAEALLAEPSDDPAPESATWTPPDDLPALPAACAARATALLARQQRAAHEMTERLAVTRRHATAAANYTSGRVTAALHWDHSV